MPIDTLEIVADLFEEWLVGADLDSFNIQCKTHFINKSN